MPAALRKIQDPATASPPAWLPEPVAAYLQHVCGQIPIRELARRDGRHASTILRQIRRVEQLRDDMLRDEALERLAALYSPATSMEPPAMSAAVKIDTSDAAIESEARRILRRLCETRAFLLVSPDLDKAAVFRETVPGRRTRTAVVEREVAQIFALNEWIEGESLDRMAKYTITQLGRAALKRIIAADQAEEPPVAPSTGAKTYNRAAPAPGFAEAPMPFIGQQRAFGEREVRARDGSRKVRYNLAESPLTALARKKDKAGNPYLSAADLEAGERLREDFEIAQTGPRVAQNWDRFLTTSSRGEFMGGRGPAEGPAKARERVAAALEAMGPQLADVAFRCCCFLEGLETTEKRLGWSARSGKVVLKIALERLRMHYDSLNDPRLIG